MAERERDTRPGILLAGAEPVGGAGNAVSSEVMLDALSAIGDVTIVTHEAHIVPRLRHYTRESTPILRLGTQPVSVHAEALLAGSLHRRELRAWTFAWAVNSRYATSLMMAGVPYAVWEATTIRDELRVTDVGADRRSGRGSGLGTLLHRATLSPDEALEGVIYRRARALCAMSHHTRAVMIESHGLAPDRVAVLDHPPTPEFLCALDNARATHGRAEAARPEFRLLFVGRVDDPRKGFPLLLDALQVLNSRGANATLSVIGPYSARWPETIASHPARPSIVLHGRVPTMDLAKAYLTHDVLVVPSKQEGFGIVVAEALHAGLPVVSTRCGGPEHVISESGGGLLTAHNANALADAIARLEQPDFRAPLSRRAEAYARDTLSITRFREQVASVYRTATARS